MQSGYSNQAPHQPPHQQAEIWAGIYFFVGLYYLEFFIEGLDYYHWQDQLFVNTPYKIDKGHASMTEAPGWGVEINPAWLEASHYQKLALADMPGLEVHR